jgi:hypothetical protein
LAVNGLPLPASEPACSQSGGIQHRDDLLAGAGGAVTPYEVQRGGRGVAGTGAGDGQLVGGAGMPPYPDADLPGIGLGQQGDIGDKCP